MTGTFTRYRYFDQSPVFGGEILVDAKETKSAFILRLVSFRVRYPHGGIDTLLFGNADGLVRIPKRSSTHALNIWPHDFVLYPYRAGVPFLFVEV